MFSSSKVWVGLRYSFSLLVPRLITIILALFGSAHSQTASTGALTGFTLDPSGALLPGATIHLARSDGAELKSAVSDRNGRFAFALLPPDTYSLQASKAGFKDALLGNVRIYVTETVRVELDFQVATHLESAQVSITPILLDSPAVGRAFGDKTISALPLVTRNFTQITTLASGVAAAVNNAGELGSGGTALSPMGPSSDGVFVNGARSYDNNWQMDGVSVSDVMASGPVSGGIPLPNPDTLQEFKVQTGLYDATFGRAAGAVVSVVSKGGTNQYHGSLFEFLRNNILNANDFFLNETGQPRPDLKQNQFGATFGGPIRRNRAFFFGSYQGTRQVNGIAAGQARIACNASLTEPALTSDRSAAALGQLFGGIKGAQGGVAVNPDGSNINPVALALLNFKLPDGSFLIPSPQKVNFSKPVANQGFSVISQPCSFDEDQGMGNIDYEISERHHLSGRFYISDGDQSVTFPGNGLNTMGNIPGFLSPGNSNFAVFSLAHTYVLSSTMLNEARIGYVRTRTQTGATAPFRWSDVGVSEGEMNSNNELPSLNILGSVSMAPAFPRTYTQNSYLASDVFSVVKGAHSLTFGGSVTRMQDNLTFAGAGSFVQFLSWPDFLLGLNATQNGTGTFSNVFASADIFGLLDREFRVWEGSAFAQDDYRITRMLTFNAGLRYEHIGQFGDQLGRNSSLDVTKADPNPPPQGSVAGYIVASNFPGSPPPGVIRVDNSFGNYSDGQNAFAPRLGFAWQILPDRNSTVLRGGYGIYYSRITGQAATKSVVAAPFALTRIVTGLGNAAATFQTPFAQPFPTQASFPLFQPYSPTTATPVNVLAPDARPAMVQQYSLNLQQDFCDFVFEVGYVGTRGTRLLRTRSLNQALSASPANPIRGATSNTLANIGERIPIPGIRPDSLREVESEGSSWYNALQASLSKRWSRGLELLISYTFSKALDTDGADINSTSSGNGVTLGDQNDPAQRWGRSSFDRAHRFVASGTWTLPGPGSGRARTLLGGWSISAITIIQSGSALTIADTNSTNVFGISEDRAQLSGACSTGQLLSSGSLQSKLNRYFNTSCFSKPVVIGADGKGTVFGNSATGLVDGPGQGNLDFSFGKLVALPGPGERSTLEFRAEFFNALNHTQFANPDSNFSSATFGVISSTAVNPRVGQLAVKFAF